MKLSGGQLSLVNRGSNSEIYRYGTKEKGVVLKVIKRGCKRQCKHLLNQFTILNSLEHDNIIKVLKYKNNVHLRGTGCLYNQTDKSENGDVLILESAAHGSLLEFYRKTKVKIAQARWIFAELCEAVRYLHCNYFVHRDLKLDNVMVMQNEFQVLIKLADFGFAASAKNSSASSSFKGTKRGYMAPEIHELLSNPQLMYDMYKGDIFALGVILFALVLGRLPFQQANKQNYQYSLIAEGKHQQFWKWHTQALNKLQFQEDLLHQEFKIAFLTMVHPDPVIKFPWMMGRQQLILPLETPVPKIRVSKCL